MVRTNKLISDLCESSSLHGFNRLSTGSHRLLWILVVALATAICIAMFAVQLYSFENHSTSTIFETSTIKTYFDPIRCERGKGIFTKQYLDRWFKSLSKHRAQQYFQIDLNYPTSLVRFPHIEICPLDKIYRPNARNLEEIVVQRGFAESREEFFSTLRDLLTKKLIDQEKKKQIIKTLLLLGYTERSLYLEVGTSCEAILLHCSWGKIDIDCNKMFQRVVSYEGICCRFDVDYFKNTTRELNMKYNSGYTPETGLNVDINLTTGSNTATKAEIYFFTDDRTYSDYSYELDVSNSMTVGVIPLVKSSGSYLHNISPSRRNCGRINKNSPSAVDIETKYSYDECITHYYHKVIFERCKCLPFYVKDVDPRGGWDKVDICTSEDYGCVKTVAADFSNDTLPANGCLYACDTVKYKYAVKIRDNSKLGWKKSTLSIYYSNSHCPKVTKIVLLTWDQLFASLGGIFGLCLGGSIISILEFLYAFVSYLHSSPVDLKKKVKKMCTIPKDFKRNEEIRMSK